MPTTLTLKNIPDALYGQLKIAATLHRRSLNGEAIVGLESVLLPSRISAAERLANIRALRVTLPNGEFHTDEIDALKRAGGK